MPDNQTAATRYSPTMIILLVGGGLIVGMCIGGYASLAGSRRGLEIAQRESEIAQYEQRHACAVSIAHAWEGNQR